MADTTEGDVALAQSRWLPPPPHREAVLQLIAAGRAHVEEQGHGKPPLLVHEDGGVLELPLVRIGGRGVVAESKSSEALRLTRHGDVCGCLDEIEAWLQEDPAGLENDPARLDTLLSDALYMCGRMERRLQAYRAYAARIAALAAQMQALTGPDTGGLAQAAEDLRRDAATGAAVTPGGAQGITRRAEAMRDVANGLESALRQCRGAATELGALYERIRGARNWDWDVAARSEALRDPTPPAE